MNNSELVWRTRERHISYENMRNWLPSYQKSFEHARMRLSANIIQPKNPEECFYDIEVSDKRLDDRQAQHKALALQGWQYVGTQKEELYEQRKPRIQEKYGDHLTIPAVCERSGRPRDGYAEVFAQKDVLEQSLGDIVNDLNFRRVTMRAIEAFEMMEKADEDNSLPPPETPPPKPLLRLVVGSRASAVIR